MLHPDPLLLLNPATAAATIHLDYGERVSINLHPLLRSQAAHTPADVLADESLDRVASIDIADAIIDTRERMIVLDSRANELLVFDSMGELAQRLGGWGTRPGDIAHPQALHTAGTGYLAVFDGLGKVLIYESTGDSIRYSHEFAFEGQIFDGCIPTAELLVSD